jgi:hypothetical protein
MAESRLWVTPNAGRERSLPYGIPTAQAAPSRLRRLPRMTMSDLRESQRDMLNDLESPSRYDQVWRELEQAHADGDDNPQDSAA